MQYGALCWRRAASGIEVLLITSRDTGRWVIPKGWPMVGLAPEAAAAQEAWEEAGVTGQVNPVCLGRFGYMKLLSTDATVPCAVAVFGLKVTNLADKYPEMKERNRRWFSLAEAAEMVDEPDLGRLIAGFAPPPEGRPVPISDENDADVTPHRPGTGAR
jgi:8-oxo-dGTP pyrophosphatase MutT (NUDIX family)